MSSMDLMTDADVSRPTGPDAGHKPDLSAELERVRYGARLVGGAFVLLGVVFAIAVWRFTAARDVTAAVGSVATVVGTIIGAFFGIHIGSAGKESAEDGRARAEAKHARAETVAQMALAKLDPRDADEVLNKVQ